MGLDVGEFRPRRAGKRRQRADLIEDVVLYLLGPQVHRPATEAHQVRESRVGTDAHAVAEGQPHGPVHHHRVPGVIAAGDVGRSDQRHQRLVRAEGICPETLSHVAVQVYGHGRDIVLPVAERASRHVHSRTGCQIYPLWYHIFSSDILNGGTEA